MPVAAAFASTSRKLGRHLAHLAIVGACASLALAPARAEERSSTDAPPEAIEHYQRGRAHYQAGRYREAVVELEQALALDPGSPNLVYNLARVYELLGDIEQAIAYYERYRAMLPPEEEQERERITTAIQRLQGAKHQLVNTPPRPVQTERGVADGAFWTLASLSFAALAAGAVTGALAVRADREAESFVLGKDGNQRDFLQKVQRADRLAVGSDVALAVGVVGGLTSILLFALRSRPVLEPGMAILQQGAVLTLRGDL